MCVAYFNMFVSAETLGDFKKLGFSIELEKRPIDNTSGYKYWMAIEDGEIIFKTNISLEAWLRDREDNDNGHPLRKAVNFAIKFDPEVSYMRVDVEVLTRNVAFQFFPRQDAHIASHR